MSATETLESIAKPDGRRNLSGVDAMLGTFQPVDLELPIEEFIPRQEKWDRRFLDMAELVSTWSKDPSTKVGAVIVSPGQGKYAHSVVATGYNGFPRGVKDHVHRYADRPTKYKLVAHAELNACLQAGDRARGGTIYVYPAFGMPPLCSNCAKAVIQSGIIRVVGWEADIDDATAERWREELEAAYVMCYEAGVEMTTLTP